MSELFPPSAEDLVQCIRREIALREQVYPRRVADRRMSQRLADRELLLMRAVLKTLERSKAEGD
jgi:hypothetical protein